MTRTGRTKLVLAALLVGSVAAGTSIWYFELRMTKAKVLEAARPEYMARVQLLKQVASNLSGAPAPARLDPQPIYDEVAGSYNCDFVGIDRLSEFRPNPAEGAVDTDFGDRFETVLYWLGDSSGQGASESTNAWYNDMVRGPLSCRYIVLYRVLRAEPVRWLDEQEGDKSYAGGDLQIAAFIVDVETRKLLGTYQVTATGPDRVRARDVVNAVNAGIWADGRAKLKRGLEQFGGRVALKD